MGLPLPDRGCAASRHWGDDLALRHYPLHGERLLAVRSMIDRRELSVG